MNDDINGLRDDIAFIRALAEEGRAPQLLGGASLLVAGVIYSIPTLFCWAMVTKVIVAPTFWYTAVWVIAGLVQWVVMGALIRRWRQTSRPGAQAPANRAFRSAWAGCGYAIIAIFIGSLTISWRLHTNLVFATFPTIVFAIYGGAWTVSAVMSNRVWVRWVAGGCFLAAIVLASLPSLSEIYLACLISLLALVAAPGLALVWREPSPTV